MRINYISGTEIISRVYDEFNIKSDDFVNRVPKWIYNCLKRIDHHKVYSNLYIKGKFENNKIYLPSFEGNIKMLSINGIIIINSEKDELPKDYSSILTSDNTIISDDNTFNANNALSKDESLISNFINTSTENKTSAYYIEQNVLYVKYISGTYKLWYECIPVEFNDKFQSHIPLIPDLENVIEHIKWGVFKNVLSRGYIHPLYSLGSKDPVYDPNKMYNATKLSAKLELDKMDINDRNNIANINMQFITEPSYYTGQVNNIYQLFKESEL